MTLTAELLPSMSRLFVVWGGEEDAATRLEHATHVFGTMWTVCLRDVDFLNGDDWYTQSPLMRQSTDLHKTIARTIDDEVTWALGNRVDRAVLVDDDFPEVITVGELVGHVTMFAAVLEKWPNDGAECPAASVFRMFGQRYDRLVSGLNAGSRLQPRRRSHGAPPVPKPQRIDLGAFPNDEPAQ